MDVDHNEGLASPDAEPCGACLHEDILSLVFSALDVADRARASRACRAWRAAALQPPHSATLTLSVLLIRDPTSDAERETIDRRRVEASERLHAFGHAVPKQRVMLPGEAVALLRGPLCAGVQQLSFGIVHPRGGGTASSASALGAISEALPPALRSLAVSQLAGGWYSETSRLLLGHLDLPHTAPLLEDLELGPTADLAYLDLGHPALRRLGALVRAGPETQAALRRLPRLAAVGWVEVAASGATGLAALADAGVVAERLELVGHAFGGAHAPLLRPGSALRLYRCPLPAAPDEPWALPAGLAALQLDGCSLSPALLRSLLKRPNAHAPGVGRISISFDPLNPSHGLCGPADVVAALACVSGGTPVEIRWPHDRAWMAPEALAPLARALACTPVLHRYVDLALYTDLSPANEPAISSDFARDFESYLRAREAALRAMP